MDMEDDSFVMTDSSCSPEKVPPAEHSHPTVGRALTHSSARRAATATVRKPLLVSHKQHQPEVQLPYSSSPQPDDGSGQGTPIQQNRLSKHLLNCSISAPGDFRGRARRQAAGFHRHLRNTPFGRRARRLSRPVRFGDVVEVTSPVTELAVEASRRAPHRRWRAGGERRRRRGVWAVRSKSQPERIAALAIPGEVIARFG